MMQLCCIESTVFPFAVVVSPPHISHSCFEPIVNKAIPAFVPGCSLRSVIDTVLQAPHTIAIALAGLLSLAFMAGEAVCLKG